MKELLLARGATPGRPSRQVDTYYNAPHRDFLDNRAVSEWLRIPLGPRVHLGYPHLALGLA
ncbi:hypothetical protein PUR61_40800 [Streptomyces sp. BE20]|uniref:hypothetical protein n=1 Tax=Streptomyces sp. BE20 TaxID=3002525 RepID=UPI002E794A37|nr:hypothetical protein [Streptomyces sp. BE20]MEE1828461.1 hypothetical protein [Streptomyces sp. BE20]